MNHKYEVFYLVNYVKSDIALMKFDNPVTYSREISPICLPTHGNNLAKYGKTGVVTGWGETQGIYKLNLFLIIWVFDLSHIYLKEPAHHMYCAKLELVFIN